VRKAVLSVLSAATAVALAACGASSTGSSTSPTDGPSGSSPSAGPSGQASQPTDADRSALEGITVSDTAAGEEPKITLTKSPVTVSTTTVKVLKEGTGTASKAGDQVAVFQVLVHGGTGKVLDTSYGQSTPASFTLAGQDVIPGLVRALTGAAKGSRILFVIPPVEAFGSAGLSEAGIGPKDNLVVVADIMDVTTPKPVLSEAQGTVVTPPAGLPTVAFNAGKPTVTIPKADPPTSTVTQPLITGTGAKVTAGQRLTVNYHGVIWKDGSVFDSSWDRGSAATFQIGVGGLIKAWDDNLVGQTVGSRLLLIVPPADGYGSAGRPPAISGTDTLVFVIDILGAE
jgi:peptidylprolyl isomerase